MANTLFCLVLVGVLLAIANVTAASIPPTTPEPTGAAAHRALLMGPADAFNRASRPHMAGKETGGPSKAVGIEPEPTPAPAPAPVPAPEQLGQPASPAAAAVTAAQPTPGDTPDKAKDAPDTAATKPTKPHNNKVALVHRHSHKNPKAPKPAAAATAASTAVVTAAAAQPAAAAATQQQQQRNLLGSPADIFNKATHARHATKEASGPSKATGVNTPPQPQQQPSSTKPLAVTEPGSRRAMLQYGWSGSSASASASASAGSGGWGGDSWAGAQAQAQSQSQSFGGGFDSGFGGYGFGRKLRAAARN